MYMHVLQQMMWDCDQVVYEVDACSTTGPSPAFEFSRHTTPQNDSILQLCLLEPWTFSLHCNVTVLILDLVSDMVLLPYSRVIVKNRN